jgi:lipopolysaccharide/colanic/teichoic acid biosynthesis glycosyltransferase
MSLKRGVDVLIGSVLAALAIPLVLLFALIVLVELRTQPFFWQERVGRNGRLFRMPKLRTLPNEVHPYTSKDTIREDSIPSFCGYLRRSHLDELPQLFLVPLGKMSLVGPRPKMPDWAEPIDPLHGSLRTSIQPGCTGLWQVGKDTHLRVADCPDYDYFYLRNACLPLDFWILWRTALMFLGVARGVPLSQVPRRVCRNSSPWPPALSLARREHPARWSRREKAAADVARDAGR